MLEELDLGDMAPSGGPTPQPSTVWSRGAHAHSHAHHEHADHDVDGTDDEGTRSIVVVCRVLTKLHCQLASFVVCWAPEEHLLGFFELRQLALS